jgi:hypothetical protein
MMEAASTSKMLVNSYQTSWHNNQEDGYLPEKHRLQWTCFCYYCNHHHHHHHHHQKQSLGNQDEGEGIFLKRAFEKFVFMLRIVNNMLICVSVIFITIIIIIIVHSSHQNVIYAIILM